MLIRRCRRWQRRRSATVGEAQRVRCVLGSPDAPRLDAPLGVTEGLKEQGEKRNPDL